MILALLTPDRGVCVFKFFLNYEPMRKLITILPIGTNPVVTLEISIWPTDSFSPPISMCGQAEKNESESGWQEKMQFTLGQNTVIKRENHCEVTGSDHISHSWVCDLPIYLKSYISAWGWLIVILCCQLQLPGITFINATSYSLNTLIGGSATWNFQNPRCQIFPNISIIIVGPPMIPMISISPLCQILTPKVNFDYRKCIIKG